MDTHSMMTLEYDQIKEQVAAYAVSYAGQALVREMEPMTVITAVHRAAEETQEAAELLAKGSSVPIPSLEGLEYLMSMIGTGYLFTEQDFSAVQQFLQSCGQLRKYMAAKAAAAPRIAAYASSLFELTSLKEEIERCIRFGRIEDQASKGLDKARKRIAVTKERLHKKLDSIMSRHQSILQENLYSQRGGRYVIPVKREYHKQVKGAVLDQSTSGQTVFVEPEEIAHLQSELDMLKGDEAREEAIILSRLTALLEEAAEELRMNIEVTAAYDFIFARAKFGRSIGGGSVSFNEKGILRIVNGRHPGLKGMIPIRVELGGGYQSLIVTGPNTGGKTVVLRTIGLLSLMAQSGLLVPAGEGSEFPVYWNIMSVIGDGQNMEQSLSTFSAQMASINRMLKEAGKGVLLLIDELAAGTDPGEGIALSIAILEELSRRGANIVVTTHFNELKQFAATSPSFQNARMEFDAETLRPLYRLTIGEAGRSYALQIAEKLGLDAKVIQRARQFVEAEAGETGDGGTGAMRALYAQTGDKRMAEKRMAEPASMQAGRQIANPEAGKDGRSSQEEMEETSEIPETPETPAGSRPFEVGDAVYITSLRRVGIVYELQDGLGRVGVMVQKQKIKVNHKRLKPYLSKDSLYPEDYDFDIIFDSKENRKKRKVMRKRHVEGLTITKEQDPK
ncbi:DNA mismatch repair protein MutS [Paenibacillus sp. CN-4]|uniref:endonuclease MutS2 n=1 Tax=Paenibacillus nanchangensis TaxID=3348343 RepID=UPI00397E6FA9